MATARFLFIALVCSLLTLSMATFATAEPGPTDEAAKDKRKIQRPAPDKVREITDRLTAQRLKVLDKDSNGEVSLEEYLTAQEEAFRRIDTDGNGALSAKELRGLGRVTSEYPSLEPSRMGGVPSKPLDFSDQVKRMVEAMDRDENGAISSEEYRGAPDRFAEADANDDDQLTQNELLADFKERYDPARYLKVLIRGRDRDNDERLSREEFPGVPELFGDADADADGFLTGDELAAYVKENPAELTKLRSAIGQRAAPGAAPHAPHGERDGLDSAQLAARLIATRDSDGDGRLSRKEIGGLAGSENLFDQLDANDDGYLTQEELKASKTPLPLGRPTKGTRQE